MSKSLLLILIVATSCTQLQAQTGTYQSIQSNGSSCSIAIEKEGNKITGNVFAWWHTASGRHGVFTGIGILKENSCTLTSLDDAHCRVILRLATNSIHVKFEDCMLSNLPGDFSGNYIKITNRLPGIYTVTAKAYFYPTDSALNPQKAYLTKGDKVNIDLENITAAKRVLVNYTNTTGKSTTGYIDWHALQ